MGFFSRSPRRSTDNRYNQGPGTTANDGYNDGRHGYNDGRHGYNDRRDGYNDGRDGYNDGRDGYNDGRDGYNDGRRGHNDGRHGYNDGMTGGNTTDSRRHHGGRFGSRGFGSRSGKLQSNRGHREKRGLFDINSGHYNRRPSFGTWLKYTWLDILTMVAMGAIGLGIYEANPAPTRSFPVTFSDGQIVYPQFAYPLRKEIIPIWAAALMASLIPIFIILCMQFRIRSFWDVNNGIIGLLYSLIGAAVFQVFVKWLIGGLRPHFLDVCQPDLSKVFGGGNGYQNIMYTSDICTGDQNQINDSLESMPSGHSTAAFAGFLYLYFYLNGKLKVFSNHHPAMWKLIALYAPVLGATLITGSLTIDEFHNWYDCLAGAIIGSVFAISAYRMVYASVWDFRFNHLPLTRHTPFSYGAGAAGAGGFETAVFTRSGGWGHEEAYGGAPFDSAFSLRGAGGGGVGGGGGIAMTDRGHTTALGDKNTGYRTGDVEHNAALDGDRHRDHHHRGLGRDHDRDRDYDRDNYNNTSAYTAPTGVTQPTATHHHNSTLTRDGHNNTLTRDGHNSPLTHDRDYVDKREDYTGDGQRTNILNRDGHNNNNPLNRDSDYVDNRDSYGRDGETTVIGDTKYRTNRKSMERKAIGHDRDYDDNYDNTTLRNDNVRDNTVRDNVRNDNIRDNTVRDNIRNDNIRNDNVRDNTISRDNTVRSTTRY